MSIPEPRRRRVVHLTSVHARYDIRIYRKQCRSLAKAGFDVSLIVADGKGDEVTADGVRIYDVGRMEGRINRIFRSTRRVLERALALDADLYQLHDPELLPAGAALRRHGKAVIFDSHEDVPKQMLGKPYLNPFLLCLIAWVFARYEGWVVGRLSAVIGATPSITEKFSRLAKRAVNVNNYPMLGELESDAGWEAKAREICYVGGISALRGIYETVDALDLTTNAVRLNLVGEFSEADVERTARQKSGWKHVNSLGFQDRAGVRDVMARSMAGMVILAPVANHIDAQPNKMFEYMSAGIPVIASDFPLWREIIEGSDCGLCVNPGDPAAIAGAIDTLVADRPLAERMGRNGKRAVVNVYNWGQEEPKLISLYEELLK